MTRDEILNMPAGREMDALIAKHLMKVTSPHDVYCFSTDISYAWDVVGELNELGFDVHVSEIVAYRSHDENLSRCVIKKYNDDEPTIIFEANTDTAPLAICRAALLAVMEVE